MHLKPRYCNGSSWVSLIQKFRGVFLPLHVLLFPKSQHLGRSKQHFLDPKRVFFGKRAVKQPANQPNRRLPENQRHPKYLIIWGNYDPIELGPYEPKTKSVVVGVAKKKADFRATNPVFVAKNPCFFWKSPKFLVTIMAGYQKTTFLCWPCCTAGLVAAAEAHFWRQNLHFLTLQPFSHLFLGSDGSNSVGS